MRTAVSVLFVCILGAVGCTTGDAGEGSPEDGAATLHGAVRDPLPDVSEMSLPKADAPDEQFSFQPAEGEIQLVYFGYTSCPDVCPTTFADIRAALRELGPDADRVQVIFATVDPQRDTADIVTNYVTSFVEDAVGLRTEDDSVLRPVTDAFGMSYETDHSDPDDPQVAHSGFTYVVTDDGKLAVQWAFGTTSQQMLEDIQILLAA